MSAIPWEPAEGLVPPRPRRPHLVVVPSGAATSAPEGGLRLTARGRLVLLVIAAVLIAAVLGLRGLGGAGAAEGGRTVIVEPGQTLSEIAAAQLPGLSISQGVLAIQLANGLSTAQVGVGQRLVVPRG